MCRVFHLAYMLAFEQPTRQINLKIVVKSKHRLGGFPCAVVLVPPVALGLLL